MASIPLPLGDRIAQTSQENNSERYINVQFGDGYEQLARDGINSRRSTWRVTWEGLQADEAKLLRFLFKELGGADSVSWQTPLDDQPEKWTVMEHGAQPSPAGGPFWNYSATLIKRNL